MSDAPCTPALRHTVRGDGGSRTLTMVRLEQDGCAADVCAAAVALLSDPEAARYLSGYGRGWAAHARAWVHRGLREGTLWGLWAEAAERQDAACLAGLVFVEPLSGGGDAGGCERTVEYIVRRELWGRGLGTLAAAGSVEIAAQHYAADSVVAMIHAENKGSVAVAERAGFQHRDTTTYSMNNVDRTVLKYVKVVAA